MLGAPWRFGERDGRARLRVLKAWLAVDVHGAVADLVPPSADVGAPEQEGRRTHSQTLALAKKGAADGQGSPVDERGVGRLEVTDADPVRAHVEDGMRPRDAWVLQANGRRGGTPDDVLAAAERRDVAGTYATHDPQFY